MLTQHLRELEKDHLIERIEFNEKRPHVEYRLSEYGQKLMPILFEARLFSAKNPS